MTEKLHSSYLLNFSRILSGIVFIYSGFVKGIDPLGSAYKFTDYFVAFNMEFLESLALPFSVLLSGAELLIGIALVSGVHMVLASWALLVFMSFFTLLTLFIAFTDPVSDCGCFGDAIILTNWQTFWKNAVLMIFVLYVFVRRRNFGSFFNNRIAEWAALIFLSLMTFGVFTYSYMNLPVIDFRPFSIGSNIPEKMSVPPDAPADEYEITLYYQKGSEIRPFSTDSLPGTDWQWVRTESTLISKGYEPPITDFYIESIDYGEDHSYEILNDPGYTFIVVSYNLEKSAGRSAPAINRLAEWSSGHGVNFICLTASPVQQIDDFIERTGSTCQFYHSDEITLKTVIRSNPGLLLLKGGTVLGKWHHRNIPHNDELKEDLLSYALEEQQKSRNNLISFGYLAALLITISILRRLRQEMINRRATRVSE